MGNDKPAGVRVYEFLFGENAPLNKPVDKYGPTKIVPEGKKVGPTAEKEPTGLRRVDSGEEKALGYKEGGEVQGPGGPTADAVPANLSNGEYVIPAHVVGYLGTKFFDELVMQAEAKAGAEQAAPNPFDEMARDSGGAMVPGGMPSRPGPRA